MLTWVASSLTLREGGVDDVSRHVGDCPKINRYFRGRERFFYRLSSNEPRFRGIPNLSPY